MAVKLTIDRNPKTREVLSVYYQIHEDDVARTVELDTNTMLDLNATNQPVGLEIVGPHDLAKMREAAFMYTCSELEAIFDYLAYLAGERPTVHA